jgi:hypothetical protein
VDIPVLGKPCDEAALTELLRSLEPLGSGNLQPTDAG